MERHRGRCGSKPALTTHARSDDCAVYRWGVGSFASFRGTSSIADSDTERPEWWNFPSLPVKPKRNRVPAPWRLASSAPGRFETGSRRPNPNLRSSLLIHLARLDFSTCDVCDSNSSDTSSLSGISRDRANSSRIIISRVLAAEARSSYLEVGVSCRNARTAVRSRSAG